MVLAPGERFDGGAAMVTGAGHGIGRACAHRLAGEGARVVVADLDLDAAQRVVAELPARPASAHLALAIDITSTAAVEAAVERAVHHLGGLDVLVNVAPADVAAAVAFLAYRDAGWITGHTLPVDGGLLTGYRPL